MLNTEQAIESIKNRLRNYLESLGTTIPTNGNFRCPIPTCSHRNGDRNPSAGFVPGSSETLVHCFSSGRTVDIFHILAGREGLPSSGSGFYRVTVPKAAEIFGIEYEQEELSEEQKTFYQKLRAYRDAALYISRYPNEIAESYISQRGWTVDLARRLMIGAVKNYRAYIDEMNYLGWDTDFLKEIELTNQAIFHEDNLIFTICNQDGAPSAFVARDMKFETRGENERSLGKYRNSSAGVYQKGSTLYNFHMAGTSSIDGDIWVFEGYGDCVTAIQNGIYGACSTGGTAITKEHIDLLATAKARTINIAFDGDKEGILAVNKMIDRHFGERVPMNFRIVLTPDEMDPDEYIRKEGMEKFMSLPRKTLFEWKLDTMDGSEEDITASAIGIILSENDIVKRHYLGKALSERTKIPFRRIMDELERREREADSDTKDKIEFIIKSVQSRLKEEKDNPENVLSDGLYRIEEIKKRNNFTIIDHLEEIDQIRSRMINPIYGFSFGTTKTDTAIEPNMPTLHKATDGLPRYGSLIVFSGIPGSGKTSFLRYLFYNVVIANPDVRVVFMSIDDNKAKIYQSIISLSQGIPMSKVRKYHMLGIDERERWDVGWRFIKEMSPSLQVYDANNGTTLRDLEAYIRKSQEEYPDKQTVVILDNFHKLTDFPGSEDKNKNAYCVSMIKNMTTKFDVPIFMTVELRKLQTIGARPTMVDLKDTVQISYDADMIWLLHNDLHVNPSTNLKWSDQSDITNVVERPIIELDIVKNKETGWKGRIHLQFEDHMSRFRELPQDKVKELYDEGKTGHRSSGITRSGTITI